MRFEEYYLEKFKNDLIIFFATIPDDSKFHEDRDQKLIYSIQFERLTSKYNHLDFLDSNEKIYFAYALFYIILLDMVTYSHFRNHYDRFQSLTNYPKLIGNCLKWCQYHLHPNNIFRAMNIQSIKKNTELTIIVSFMQSQIFDFIEEHIPQIDFKDYWIKFIKEIK